jgi:hypothetical protein
MDGRVHATDGDIAAGEMLFAMDDDGPVFHETGSDAVGAFERFAPAPAIDKSGAGKVRHVAIADPAFENGARGVAQENAAA